MTNEWTKLNSEIAQKQQELLAELKSMSKHQMLSMSLKDVQQRFHLLDVGEPANEYIKQLLAEDVKKYVDEFEVAWSSDPRGDCATAIVSRLKNEPSLIIVSVWMALHVTPRTSDDFNMERVKWIHKHYASTVLSVFCVPQPPVKEADDQETH